VAEIQRLFGDGARLVTLTGMGGTGKTRVAIAAAEAARPGEAVFVDLSPITDAEHVLLAIMRSLGLAAQPAFSPQHALEQHLRERELLLVLDNFEQLLPAAPRVEELLAACAGLRMLVT